MDLVRLRRLAWLLILVLVAGLATPVLASASPSAAAPGPVTHRHADGTVHTHAAQPEHGHIRAAGDRDAAKHPHCPGCVTDAACAVSCLGLAVLPAAVQWTVSLATATWTRAAMPGRPGVAPAGDIDPPRPVLHS